MDGLSVNKAVAEYDKGIEYFEKRLFPQALLHFQQAISADPQFVVAYYFVSQIKTFKPGEPLIERYRLMIHDDQLDPELIKLLHLALAKIFVDVGLAYKSLWQIKLAYQQTPDVDWEKKVAFWNRLPRVFTQSFLQQQHIQVNKGPNPVFLVATKHTGLRQIKSWFSQNDAVNVVQSGAIDWLIQQVSEYTNDAYPESCKQLDFETTRQLAGQYHAMVSGIGHESKITLDVLESVEHLGFISLLFPQAKIVLMQRDPVELSLSQYYDYEGPDYATNLTILGVVHQGYRKLLQHWLSSLPVSTQVVQVSYEQLFNEPQAAFTVIQTFCHIDPPKIEPQLYEGATLNAEVPGWSTVLHDHASELMNVLYSLSDEREVAYYQQGLASIEQKDWKTAKRLLNRACSLGAKPINAFQALAQLQSGEPETMSFQHMQAVVTTLTDQPCQARQAYFALAKHCDNIGDDHNRQIWLQKAQAIRCQSLNVEHWHQWLQLLRQSVTQTQVNQQLASQNEKAPIFVLGLPGSGRELVAEEFSSFHDGTQAYAEHTTQQVIDWLESITKRHFPLCLQDVSADQLVALAAFFWQEQQDAISGRVQSYVFTGDLYYLYAGLFMLLFPNARWIHCVSDRKTQQQFLYEHHCESEPLAGLDELDKIDDFLDAYDSLMQHWQSIVPNEQWLRVDEVGSLRQDSVKYQQLSAFCH